MSETLNQIQQIPNYVAVGGAVAGMAYEYAVQHRIDGKRQALAGVWGEVVGHQSPNRLRRFSRAAISIGAVGGALIGLVNANAWIDSDSEEIVAPNVEVVVDKSGATLDDGAETARTIQSILLEMDENLSDDYTMRAWVTSKNVTETVTLQDAANIQPFGDAPMSAAMNQSIGEVVRQRDELEAGEAAPNNAIVVITNGNQVSDGLNRTALERSKSPVYIFDVSDGTADSAGLEDLSEETSGAYFSGETNATPENREEAIEQIKENIESVKADNAESADNWLERIKIGVLSLLTIITFARIRPKLTSDFIFRSNKKLKKGEN